MDVNVEYPLEWEVGFLVLSDATTGAICVFSVVICRFGETMSGFLIKGLTNRVARKIF